LADQRCASRFAETRATVKEADVARSYEEEIDVLKKQLARALEHI
jgi:hypothetical protein